MISLEKVKEDVFFIKILLIIIILGFIAIFIINLLLWKNQSEFNQVVIQGFKAIKLALTNGG